MTLLVLDGNSILNRAFYGIRLLTTKEGLYTNAIYGFLSTLNRLKEESSPDAVAIAFDLRAPTFRHLMYDGYKAQRKGMPEELAAQMPLLKELLTLMGYTLVECEGYEADDILGTLARHCEETGDNCVIATGDRDSLQLVSSHTTVRLTATKQGRPEVTVYTEEKIREDYGVPPKSLIDIKAIQGDASDNIPGVAGIGQKGAGDLIREYKTIEHIYEILEEAPIKEGLRQKLRDGKEMAFLSKKLGTIVTDAPVNLDLDIYRMKERSAGLRDMLVKLEFFSMLEKMNLSSAAPAAEKPQKNVIVQEVDALNVTAMDKLILAAEIENDSIKRLCVCGGDTVYLLNQPNTEIIKQIFSCDTEKILHNSKAFYRAAALLDVTLANVTFDCMLAAYVLNPSANGYDVLRLSEEYGVPDRGEMDSLAAEALYIEALYEVLGAKITQNGQAELLQAIEQPLSRVLANMEIAGFLADADGLRTYGEGLLERVQVLEQDIYQSVDFQFNINSPKQLGEVLFERLGLKGSKKTKTGYSTNAEVLEGLRGQHPCLDMILEYRTLSKLYSTYAEGLLKVIGPDNRIHTSFIQTEARTGRLSSVEPNLQNIPVRTPLGKELRRFFVAKEGCVLIDADYNQIELRVLAHMAKDKNMIQAFNEDMDIHRMTAAEVFGLPPIMVTPLMRSRAKAVNFGIVYGIGAFSLSKDIGVTRKEAESYIEGYLRLYSGVNAFMEQCKKIATETGYAETLYGRRRYLPELASSNHNLRAFGERVAMNMPIQGTAADIIKVAMIRVHDRLLSEGLKARLILQVHDELLVEAPVEEAEQAARIVREEMEQVTDMSVVLSADVHTGGTWYDAKGE